MKNTYLVVDIYNPFKLEVITDTKGMTKEFTKSEAEKYIEKNNAHLTPLKIIEIRKAN